MSTLPDKIYVSEDYPFYYSEKRNKPTDVEYVQAGADKQLTEIEALMHNMRKNMPLKEVAVKLNLSVKTLKNYATVINRKLASVPEGQQERLQTPQQGTTSKKR